MFSFYWPWFALLLPLPFLVRRYWPRRQSAADFHTETSQSTLLHPALARLTNAFAGARTLSQSGGRYQTILLSLLWALLIGALMRPQWMEPYTEVRTEGYDLLLAVDVSRSMEALDFTVKGRKVTRMAVIKGVMERFIRARTDDRIGLVVFGSHAYVLSPMTLDVNAVSGLLQGIIPRMAGDGTAIGDAIGLGVKKLRDRPEGSRVMLLVTDGENTAGSLPPRVAASLAAQEGIRIYTIGVGSKGLVPFMEGGRMMQVSMEIDEELLTDVAERTGGAYFRAADTDALEEIYQRIDALEKTQAESRTVMIPQPLYRWPLGAALLLLLVIGMFPDGMPQYWKIGRAHG
jgi:Ca-activated chloride channel family protein